MDWQRIIRLVEQTGEKCIVVTEDSEEPLVILPLCEYEEMVEGWVHDDMMHDAEQAYEYDETVLPPDIPFEPEPYEWQPDTAAATSNDLDIGESDVSEEEPWYIEPVGDSE